METGTVNDSISETFDEREKEWNRESKEQENKYPSPQTSISEPEPVSVTKKPSAGVVTNLNEAIEKVTGKPVVTEPKCREQHPFGPIGFTGTPGITGFNGASASKEIDRGYTQPLNQPGQDMPEMIKQFEHSLYDRTHNGRTSNYRHVIDDVPMPHAIPMPTEIEHLPQGDFTSAIHNLTGMEPSSSTEVKLPVKSAKLDFEKRQACFDFALWLKGWIDLEDPNSINKVQTEAIKKELRRCFE